jgi:hypothetical protein
MLSSLLLLTPVTGVVSGGRSTASATMEGLLPVRLWMYEPGIPSGMAGTFTEITFHGLYSNSFRIVSSGETAGLHPLVASSVHSDGYAFQLAAGEFSLNCIRGIGSSSHALSYKNVLLDLRSSQSGNIVPSGEYSDRYFLLSATRKTSAFAISCPVGDNLSIGPAYCRNRYRGDFWIRGEVSVGPLSITSVPAIDEKNSYRRLSGRLRYKKAQFLYGWNGEQQFAALSYLGRDFSAEVSVLPPGVMMEYHSSESVLLVFSHREQGWLQGEVQGEFHGITAGVDIAGAPGNTFIWGFSVGIAIGGNTIQDTVSENPPWYSENAVSSFQY